MPIARREMVVLARSRMYYRARVTTGIVTLVGGIAFGIFYSRVGVQSTLPFLGVVGYMLSLMCIFTGAQVCADAIAKEKREGTLGLLFLTGLPAWQITAGKLIAHGISAFFGIFVTFPLLALLVIVGGVQPLDVFQMALALLNVLFFSASMGLFVSTISLEQKRAVGRASLMVMLFWWGLPLLARLNSSLGGPFWLSELLLLCSLNSSFVPSMVGAGLGSSTNPWLNLLCLHLLGWAFLGLATALVPRQWQDKAEQSRFSPRAWWKKLSFGNKKVRARLRAKLLEPNPFVWLASRDRLRLLAVWIVTFVMAGIAGSIYYGTGNQAAVLVGYCFLVTLIHRFMAIGAGASQLLVEQEQGTLEMILSTPMTAREVVAGQFRAAARQLRGPVTVVLLVFAGTAFALWQPAARESWLLKASLVGALLLYLFDMYTALWLSMWGAAIARDPRRAAGAAMARLFGFPLFITASTTVILSALTLFFGWSVAPTRSVVVAMVVILVIGNNIYWLLRVRRDLPARLRMSAYSRYAPEEEPSVFGALGRKLGRIYARVRRSKAAAN
jgi:ABC-type transport system involved in multi-copper enzyme maturation permease subunit